jgi:hypothetical protein
MNRDRCSLANLEQGRESVCFPTICINSKSTQEDQRAACSGFTGGSRLENTTMVSSAFDITPRTNHTDTAIEEIIDISSGSGPSIGGKEAIATVSLQGCPGGLDEHAQEMLQSEIRSSTRRIYKSCW